MNPKVDEIRTLYNSKKFVVDCMKSALMKKILNLAIDNVQIILLPLSTHRCSKIHQ